MGQRNRKRGVVKGDGQYHAVVRSLVGGRALCGKGRIHVALSGVFDPADWLSCPTCVALVSPEDGPA